MKPFLLLLLSLSTLNLLAQQAPQLIVPIGHASDITAVAFSPDGNYLLTSGGKTAKLWDRAGHEIQTFIGHSFFISSVAFAPDGKSIITGSYDGKMIHWNLNGDTLHIYSGHRNYVNAIAISPKGDKLVSGGEDNQLIIWTLKGFQDLILEQPDHVNAVAFSPDGASVLIGLENGIARLINISSRRGTTFQNDGPVSSVAFSEDGKSVLTVGKYRTAKRWSISGSLLQTYDNPPSGIQVAVFSPDDKTILTGGVDGTAQIWTLDGVQLKNYQGHKLEITSAAFSKDGQLILTGGGGGIAQLWTPEGRTLQTLRGHSSSITAMACSPDGRHLVTGSINGSLKISDLSGYELQAISGHKSRVNALAYSKDGKFMVTGSFDKTATLRDTSGKILQTFKGQRGAVSSVDISPDGRRILTGSLDKTVCLWDSSGQLIHTFTEQTQVLGVNFAPDGASFLTYCDSLKIRDTSGTVLNAFKKPYQIKTAILGADGYVLLGAGQGYAELWSADGTPKIRFGRPGNKPIVALAFSPDGKTILTGDEIGMARQWSLSTGTELNAYSGHSAEISAVAFLPNDASPVSASMDCSVKIWDPKSTDLRATLVALDSSDWVTTSPIGLFDASPGAMRMMYYLDQQNVIELEQLKERYYEPGILPMLLGFAKDNIRQVSSFTGVALYPKVDARVDTTRQELKIDLTPQNGGLGKLSLFIGNKEIEEDINSKRLTSLTVDLRKYTSFFSRGKVDTLVLRAFNEAGWVRSPAIELPYQAQFAGAKGTGSDGEEMQSLGSNTPHLYGIFIGTSDYKNKDLKLKFPDLDASSMAQAVEGAGKLLFKDRVHIRLLSTSGKTAADISTKTNIEAAFKDFAGKAGTGDVLVVYFSGHGVNYGIAETGQFYYLTKDVPSESLVDSFIRRNYTVSSTELTDWIKAIPARKQVMILDACNSGKIVEAVKKDLNTSRVRAIDRMKDRTGMYILTGSAADKVSYEDSRYGQGLLTYSLLQGMSGMALTPDKRVDVMTLFQYSRDQVPQLAKGIGGIQTPVMAFPLGGESIDIGIMNDQVTITMAQAKPVVVQAEFQEEQQFKDILRLSDALDSYFEELTLQEAQSDIVFRKVKDYDNAYSIKGRYTVNGDAVEVRGLLFKGDTPQGQVFKVKGAKSKLPALVEQVIDAVGEYIK